jgi:hypothetical protein
LIRTRLSEGLETSRVIVSALETTSHIAVDTAAIFPSVTNQSSDIGHPDEVGTAKKKEWLGDEGSVRLRIPDTKTLILECR